MSFFLPRWSEMNNNADWLFLLQAVQISWGLWCCFHCMIWLYVSLLLRSLTLRPLGYDSVVRAITVVINKELRDVKCCSQIAKRANQQGGWVIMVCVMVFVWSAPTAGAAGYDKTHACLCEWGWPSKQTWPQWKKKCKGGSNNELFSSKDLPSQAWTTCILIVCWLTGFESLRWEVKGVVEN